jgi:hypothetical protein
MNASKMFGEYPPTLEQKQRRDSLRECARILALEIQTSTPVGPNQSLAIRHVEDALTRAHKAITQDEADSREQSWTVYVDLDDRGSYVIENGELFREEPGGTYMPVGRVAAGAPRRERRL